MPQSHSPFTPKAVAFLRSLKRHNNRDWFKARREIYERDVRRPMVDAIARLAAEFRRFAPELVASPQQSLYRIYRDTRFSPNKQPLKTHAAAVFPWRGLARHQGAGLYFEVACDWVWIGGGMYAPEPPNLLRVREHMADTWPEIDQIVRQAAFRRRVGTLSGERLSRAPRGFASDHPALEYLKYRQFIAGREFPAAFAHSREFYPTLIATFKAMMPLVRFLNEPLASTCSGPACTVPPPARRCTVPAPASAW